MNSFLRRFRAPGATILVALAVLATMPARRPTKIVVFAAASLSEALDDTVRAYDNQSGDTVKISYAARSTLARQIESRAPPGVFISTWLVRSKASVWQWPIPTVCRPESTERRPSRN